MNLSLLVVTIIQIPRRVLKQNSRRTDAPSEGKRTNKERPAKLCRNSSGTGKLDFSIFPVQRSHQQRRHKQTERGDDKDGKGGEGETVPNERYPPDALELTILKQISLPDRQI